MAAEECGIMDEQTQRETTNRQERYNAILTLETFLAVQAQTAVVARLHLTDWYTL